MADSCVGIFYPCSYPLCSRSCIVPQSQVLYHCSEQSGGPDDYDRPCTCGQTSSQYNSAAISSFYTDEKRCVASNCLPSDQDLFWTTWVHFCLLEGYTVPLTLIPPEIHLGNITAIPPSASSSSMASGTSTPWTTSSSKSGTPGITSSPTSTAPPVAGQTHNAGEIVGIVIGVVGLLLTLIPILFTYKKSTSTGRGKIHWRFGKQGQVFGATTGEISHELRKRNRASV